MATIKDNLEKLEIILAEITEFIEKQALIEETTIEEFTNRALDLEELYFENKGEANKEIVNKLTLDLISDFKEKKNDRSFLQDISKLKALLIKGLSIIEKNNEKIEDSRFGSRLGQPNNHFKQLLKQQILSSSTRIFATFDHQENEGTLTETGYFKLSLKSNLNKLFSSLTTASSFVCQGRRMKLCLSPKGLNTHSHGGAGG